MQARDPRADAIDVWKAGVAAADPERLVRAAVQVQDGALVLGGERIDLSDVGRVVVVGAGKGSAAMARGFKDALGPALLAYARVEGVVAVPDPFAAQAGPIRLVGTRPAGENLPTERGVVVARQVRDLARSLGEDDVLVALFSGGGSALLPAPHRSITLEDKLFATAVLHDVGAPIEDMNWLRRSLSFLKGGKLAELAAPARVVGLLLSDVIGDREDVIASGPTAGWRGPQSETYLRLLHCGAFDPREMPPRVLARLEESVGDARSRGSGRNVHPVHNVVIGNNVTALEGAARRATELGYSVVDLSSDRDRRTSAHAHLLTGLASRIRDHGDPVGPPACILSGGETTIRVPPVSGRGGRNQHLALAMLAMLGTQGLRDVAFVIGGTDGEDGPTDAAGAVVDAGVYRRAVALGLDPVEAVRHHDSYGYFDPAGGLLRTGLTGTNVADLRVVLVSAPKPGLSPARS